jgi:hypothetical protein
MAELATLIQYFEEAEEASRDARVMGEKCRDYYDNKQWAAKEAADVRRRKQPVVTFNLVGPKVDFLLGVERQARTDPKAYPRTPKHDKAADAVTDAIRYVLDANEFNPLASDVFDNMLVEGTGGASVDVEEKRGGFEIKIHRFRWDRFGADPHSMLKDYSDARYTFVIAWKDYDEVIELWGGAKEGVDTAMAQAAETYDDKPTFWYDKRRKRVMCVDMYFIERGKWQKAIFTKGAWLEPQKASPYVDEDGMPVNGHVAVSAKVKRNGERYGAVEGWIDPQDVVNKTRSKVTHLLNTKQTFAKEGAIEDINKFKLEANKPDGHLEFPLDGEYGKDFGVIPTEQLAAPHFMMYQDAVMRLDALGGGKNLAGKEDRELSGRAVKAIQQGDNTETFVLFDTHAQWKKRIYRAVWDRIKQFQRSEWWVRVTDDEGNLKFVGLNVPVTLAEQRIADQMGLTPEKVREQFPEELEEMYRRMPQLKQQVDTSNEVAQIDVDIIIEEVPDVVNLQSEQFDLLVKMYMAAPEKINWEDVIAMSTLRNKDKILGKEMTPEQQEAAAQEKQKQDAILALQAEGMQADTQAKVATAGKAQADTIQSQEKALQTRVETNLLLTAPQPDKVAVI